MIFETPDGREVAVSIRNLFMEKIMIKIFIFTLCFTSLALAAPSEVPPAARESIEWCDIWIPQANQSALPRVLIIGDSITKGYYPGVEKRLAGKAYVARLSTSAFLSDPMLLQQIAMVLDSMKFDVIHFNNGLHGGQHGEDEYRKAFPEFLATIHQGAPAAKLIWATTTPLKEDQSAKPGEMRLTNERIAARNKIALEFLKPEGIPVDDLHTLMDGHPEYHTDNYHYNAQGISIQAKQVTAQIEKLLVSPPKK